MAEDLIEKLKLMTREIETDARDIETFADNGAHCASAQKFEAARQRLPYAIECATALPNKLRELQAYMDAHPELDLTEPDNY